MCEGALQIFDVMTFKALYLFPCNLLSVLMIDVTLYANETSNYLVLFMNWNQLMQTILVLLFICLVQTTLHYSTYLQYNSA